MTRRRRAKTPTVLQMEAVECGAASLGMILGYYGRWVPLSELRVLTGVSRDGSNARNMLTVARSFGLEAHGFRRSADEVLAGRFPVIVFWGFEHFLVVEGSRRDTVFLNDPASGPIRVSRQEFAETYSGVTLEFQPTAEFKRGGHRQATWPLIAERLRGAGLPVTIVFLCALPLGILSILIPAFTRIFIDDILIQELDSWLRPLLAAFLFALVAQATLTAIQQRMLAKLQNWLSITQSSRFVWHLMTLPLSFFSQRRTGDFAQRLQANDRIAELIGAELGGATLQAVVALATASAMLLYQPMLALVAIAAGLISALGLAYLSRLRANAVERMRAYQALLYAQTITTIQNIEHVKSIGAENESFMKWAGQQASLVNVEQRLSIINAATAVVPQFLFGIATAAVFGFGGLLVMRGELSLGAFSAFQMLMMSFTLAAQALVTITGELQEGRGDLIRLNDVFIQPPDWRHQPVPANAHADEMRGRLTVSALTFGYDQFRAPLIENFELTVEPGKSVALVGGSGSGKSTLGRLVAGLLTPWSGEVAIDGVPLTDWDRERLASSLAVVEQDVVLFDGTVRDNVALWDETITQEAIFAALKDADLLDKVMGMRGTLGAELAEGGRNLSGGQRQRLDLARALVRRPRLLILDEATSALDPISERDVLHTVQGLGCTTIMIAHRLSTIRDCDEIIVLEDGKVVERGRHEELIRHEGAYSALIRGEA